MDATEYAQFQKEIAELNGRPVNAIFQNPSQYGKGTDWFDVTSPGRETYRIIVLQQVVEQISLKLLQQPAILMKRACCWEPALKDILYV